MKLALYKDPYYAPTWRRVTWKKGTLHLGPESAKRLSRGLVLGRRGDLLIITLNGRFLWGCSLTHQKAKQDALEMLGMLANPRTCKRLMVLCGRLRFETQQ